MLYKIELTRQAEKELTGIFQSDCLLYERFLRAFHSIAQEPLSGKRLHGKLRGLNSYRMGNYRILYEVWKGRLVVVIIDLGHRREIYN